MVNYAMIALLFCILAAFFEFVFLVFLLKRLAESRGVILLLQGRVAGLESEWAAFKKEEESAQEEENEARSAEMARRGQIGVQVREENKEMRQAALNEGREVLMKPGDPMSKLGAIKGLILKYPRVAEGVARTLNREFGVSKAIGMSEDALLQEVGRIIAEGAAKPAAPAQAVSWD